MISTIKFRLAREPDRDARVVAIESGEIAAEPGVYALVDLKKCNSEGGEPVLVEWSYEKQADSDIRVGLSGYWMVVDKVRQWAIWLGGLLVWWTRGTV